jgi:hypothetical protein
VVKQWQNDDHSELEFWTPDHSRIIKAAVYDGKKVCADVSFNALEHVLA